MRALRAFPSPGSQCARILERLRAAKGAWVSNWHLMHPEDDPRRAIGQYQTRIYDLRARGYVIDCRSGRELRALGYDVPDDPGVFYYRLESPVARPLAPHELHESLLALTRTEPPRAPNTHRVCSSGSARTTTQRQQLPLTMEGAGGKACRGL